MGFILILISGGIAGWAASTFMKTGTGLLANIGIGILGAIAANFVLGFVGVSFSGFIGNMIAGFIGAVGLITGYRALQKR